MSEKIVGPEKCDLSFFQMKQILSNNSNRKTICVLGYFTNLSENDLAILIFEKKAFTEKDVESQSEIGYFSSQSTLKQDFINDIYGNFECFPCPDINSVKTTIIYPATEKHIQKYSKEEFHIVRETPALYGNLTLKHLKRTQFSLDWVYNILNHKKESNRIIFEDPSSETGFILLPDLKWDGKSLETLYCIAITHKRDIKSLRDLTADHLPLLYNIREKGIKAIHDKYDVEGSQLRIYFHYQPSFYHLHIHFTYLKYDAPGIFCEKSHLLDTVINNIELISDYYQRATLLFVVKESDALFEAFKDEEKNSVKRQKVAESINN